ncbi:MAG: hypothetical protein U1E38_00595 [Rhodospirillales bacterium]
MSDAFAPADLPLLEACCAQLEGKTQRQKHPQGSLAYAAWVCARLGSWTGYYGSPDPSSCATAGSSSRQENAAQPHLFYHQAQKHEVDPVALAGRGPG